MIMHRVELPVALGYRGAAQAPELASQDMACMRLVCAGIFAALLHRAASVRHSADACSRRGRGGKSQSQSQSPPRRKALLQAAVRETGSGGASGEWSGMQRSPIDQARGAPQHAWIHFWGGMGGGRTAHDEEEHGHEGNAAWQVEIAGRMVKVPAKTHPSRCFLNTVTTARRA